MPKKLNDKPSVISTDLAIDIYIRSRSANLFKGKVTSVTSVNLTGIFDILPMHANFITLIKDYVILDRGLPTEKKFELSTAVLSVLNNKIDVYVGI